MGGDGGRGGVNNQNRRLHHPSCGTILMVIKSPTLPPGERPPLCRGSSRLYRCHVVPPDRQTDSQSVSREAAEPLTREDKTKIRELRQRLLEEEEERIRRVEEERRRMEEEVRVTKEEAELLERKVQEASQMKAE